jgi:hypothetical protein
MPVIATSITKIHGMEIIFNYFLNNNFALPVIGVSGGNMPLPSLPVDATGNRVSPSDARGVDIEFLECFLGQYRNLGPDAMVLLPVIQGVQVVTKRFAAIDAVLGLAISY